MANNVPITSGSGTSIATDQVPGTLEHVQLFKLAYSASGVRSLVPVDANGVLVQSTDATKFLATATLNAETTKVIGTVNVAASQTIAVTQATASSLNAAVVGTGTAGTPAGNILTVQGVASMTKLLVTPDALPANQSVNAAQIAGTATVTGGVAGLLGVGGNVANAGTATANPVPVGGVFTTTPTTLTTGQTATLQFTAAQNAKQDLASLAGTVPGTATPATTAIGLPVRAVPQTTSASATLAAQNDATTVVLMGFTGAGGFIGASTLVGTITFEASPDGGTTWAASTVFIGGKQATTIVNPAANTFFEYYLPAAFTQVRARLSSASPTGTALVTIQATNIVSAFAVGGLPVGLTAQTAPGFTTQIGGTDGGTLRALNMKAASTAAVAADQSAVVALSPNSPVSATATAATPVPYTEAAVGALSQDLSGQLRITNAELTAWAKGPAIDLLRAILVELRTLTYYTQIGLNVPDEPDQIRDDLDTTLMRSVN